MYGVRLCFWSCYNVVSEKSVSFRVGKNATNLGIRTPFSHNISRFPKGWSPSIYWRGIPFERALHIVFSKVFQPEAGYFPGHGFHTWIARSRNQRNSFCAELRERHSCKSIGKKWFFRYAFMMVEVGIRGMDGEQSWILERLLLPSPSHFLRLTRKK